MATWGSGIALLLAWLGVVWWKHSQPLGVQIEYLVAPVPLSVGILAARRGLLSRAEGSLVLGFVLAEIAALLLTSPQAAVAIGVAGAVSLAFHSKAPTTLPFWLGRWPLVFLLALSAASLTVALKQERPLAGLRLILALPLLGAIVRSERGDAANHLRLRYMACSLALAAPAWCRYEPLVALTGSGIVAISSALVLAQREGSSRRRVTLRGLALSAALVLPCLVGEAVFLVLDPSQASYVSPDQGENQKHVPGGTYVWTGGGLGRAHEPNVVRWNRWGFHDVEHELAKPPGTSRVLVLGDSFVEGVQVQLEQLYHRRLEQHLGLTLAEPVEVISYGASGWGQVQELRALTEGSSEAGREYPPGLDLAPDLVIVEFLPGNDVWNNHPDLGKRISEFTLNATPARALFVDSTRKGLGFQAFFWHRVDGFLQRWLTVSDAKLEGGVYEAQPEVGAEAWDEAWDQTFASLRQLQASVQAKGGRILVVVFPGVGEVCSDPPQGADWGLPARRISSTCLQLGVPCLDLAPTFRAVEATRRAELFVEGDGHWTAEGHQLAAETTARFVVQERLLPSPD
jgi:GDSL-like Lipase/Acylhydrolase family